VPGRRVLIAVGHWPKTVWSWDVTKEITARIELVCRVFYKQKSYKDCIFCETRGACVHIAQQADL
jgi:hypothetical protein